MSFGSNVVGAFRTGTYTCTRRAGAGVIDASGHYAASAPTTFTFSGSVQPISGRALKDLKEGQRADDVKWIFTASSVTLLTIDPSNSAADVITITTRGVDEFYRVTKVEEFRVISDHNRYTVERTSLP